MISSKNKLNKTYKIAAYVRVSTEEQAANPEGSIKNQEMRIREFVKLKNAMEPFGEIVEVYSDPGISAKDMNRPSFQKMLKAVQNKDVNLILVTELSRFSRSTKDFANLQEFLEEQDCKFTSIRENFDTSGAAGAMVLNLMASIAEFERKQTGERISQSFLARAKRGLYNGGSIPLGFKVDIKKPGILIPVPEEVEMVKYIFKKFLKEGSLATTAKALNDEGFKLPREILGGGAYRSKYIRFDTVYRMLKNKSYIGIRIFQTKNGWEEVKAQWEPIIDEMTFNRVGDILKNNCSRKKTHKNKFPFTLTGVLICKKCGEMMSGASATTGSGKRIGYYEHCATRKVEASLKHKLLDHNPRRVPANKIEPLVWDEVKKFLMSGEFVGSLLTRAKAIQDQGGNESESIKLESKLKTLGRQIEVLTDRISVLPEGIDPKKLIEKLGEFQTEQKHMIQKITSEVLPQELQQAIISFDDLEVFRAGLAHLILEAENSFEIRSKIIKLIVHKVEVMADGYEIHFRVAEAYYRVTEGHSVTSDGPVNEKNSQSLVPSGARGISSNTAFKKFYLLRSRRLTFGGPNQSRTGDLSMPWTYDPNFTMGPLFLNL